MKKSSSGSKFLSVFIIVFLIADIGLAIYIIKNRASGSDPDLAGTMQITPAAPDIEDNYGDIFSNSETQAAQTESPATQAPETEPQFTEPPVTDVPYTEPTVYQPLEASGSPEISDFENWFINGVRQTGVPQEAERIADLASLTGKWKALFIYDPDMQQSSYAQELLFIDIEAGQNAVTATADPVKIRFGFDAEFTDESQDDDWVFAGSFSEGRFDGEYLETSIYITEFYNLNGKQCASGAIITASGISGAVALVRP